MNFNEFLSNFKQQAEPALVISNTSADTAVVDFVAISDNFDELFSSLQKGGYYVVTLSRNLSKETYNLIKQYTDRTDAVSICIDGVWKQLTINTNTTKLLIQVDPETLANLEQEYPIRQAVGMVFQDK